MQDKKEEEEEKENISLDERRKIYSYFGIYDGHNRGGSTKGDKVLYEKILFSDFKGFQSFCDLSDWYHHDSSRWWYHVSFRQQTYSFGLEIQEDLSESDKVICRKYADVFYEIYSNYRYLFLNNNFGPWVPFYYGNLGLVIPGTSERIVLRKINSRRRIYGFVKLSELVSSETGLPVEVKDEELVNLTPNLLLEKVNYTVKKMKWKNQRPKTEFYKCHGVLF